MSSKPCEICRYLKCGIKARSPPQIIEKDKRKKGGAIKKANKNDAKYRGRVVDIAAETRCVGETFPVSVDDKSELWKRSFDETKTLSVECSENGCTTTAEYELTRVFCL